MLYTVVSIQESLGIFIANPILAAMLRWGIDLGGGWVGLPFLVAGGLYTVALGVVAGVSVGVEGGGEEEGEGDGGESR